MNTSPLLPPLTSFLAPYRRKSERYLYSIDEGPFSTYVGGKVIDEEKLGSLIGEVSLTAGWRRGEDEWLSTESLRGEIYVIKGISKDIAVALKFLDKGDAVTTTHYYVILNPEADLTSVQDYVIRSYVPNNTGDETVSE